MKNKKKIIAAIVCVCILLVAVISHVYTITHSEHECIGEECAVCRRIEDCRSYVRTLLRVTLTAAFLYFFVESAAAGIKFVSGGIWGSSPVILHVKKTE